ncbi:hypothetical protein chiPu_0022135 [Chiloscyllium punctatum]|uniref:Retropepsins domain-containing protein n=1 Tax=Chiloscyllium punctatum TaxID=137246 RepID=A0A401RL15_CHIPU|nr:hypothetical protein [Chiloscyllium punctatum]
MTTRDSEQEPIIQVSFEGQLTPIMIDTGATYPCVQSQCASNLPKFAKFIKTVGLLGRPQVARFIAPVSLKMGIREIVLTTLVAKRTPINFLGSDALLKQELKL